VPKFPFYVTVYLFNHFPTDVCVIVQDDLFLSCLTELCHALCLLMVSYKRIVKWHEAESRNADSNTNVDKHLERQYVQRKLSSGQHRMWQDVQTKVRVLVVTKEVGTKMNINDFMKMVNRKSSSLLFDRAVDLFAPFLLVLYR